MLITLDGLTFRSPDGRVLFENLTLAFGRERTGLVGRNGVGKTTLARLIMGLCANYAPIAGQPGRFEWLYDNAGHWRPEAWQRWLDLDPLNVARRRAASAVTPAWIAARRTATSAITWASRRASA